MNAHKKFISTLLFSASALLSCHAQSTNNLPCVVVRIYDGDSVMIKPEGAKAGRKARLYGIDAPEPNQSFGPTAEARLRELVRNRVLRFTFMGEDNYGRPLIKIFADDTEVNLELIREGMAWHYDRFDATPSYAAAHAEAREHKRGLWIDPKPIMPEEFRAQQKRGK